MPAEYTLPLRVEPLTSTFSFTPMWKVVDATDEPVLHSKNEAVAHALVRAVNRVETLEAALDRLKAEAPTRVQTGEWDGVTVSEIARAALEAPEEMANE